METMLVHKNCAKRFLPKIIGEASEEFERMFPAKQPSKVVITLTDGSSYKAEVDYPKGDPREPMTQEDLDLKFESLTNKLMDEKKREKIRTTIWNLEMLENIEDLMKELTVTE